jgi:hypothetical protein
MNPRTVLLTLCLYSVFIQQSLAQENPGVAAVRLAHVSPDAPLLDLLVDGRLRLQDLAFTELSAYITLPAGEHELRVQPHRAPATPDRTVQAPEPFIIAVTLEPGRYYTLVASGFFDPPPAQDELGSLQLSMSRGTTAVVTGPRAYTATVSENTTLSELFPGTYTVSASREGFQSATYEVAVRPDETAFVSIALQASDSGESSETRTAAPPGNNLGLEWRKVQLQLYEDDLNFPPPGSALVRVIHASPITPAVSVALPRRDQDTTDPLLTELSYPNETAFFSVSAGRVSFRLLDSATGQVITELEDLELQAGTVYTFYVVATRNDSFVSVIPTVDAVLAGQP